MGGKLLNKLLEVENFHAPASPASSIEAATIAARGLAGQPMKCGGKGGGLAKSNLERNRSDGQLTIRQELLGPLNSAMRVISVRRHFEGTLKRPREMVRAQPRQLGQGRERDVVGDMRFDVVGHPLLLPTRKATVIDRPVRCRIAVDTNQLMRQQDTEGFGVLPMRRPRVLDLRLELESGLPEIAIIEEQPRLEFDLAKPQVGIGKRPARINVEIGYARQRARPLRPLKDMPGRNEGQLLREIAQGRPW